MWKFFYSWRVSSERARAVCIASQLQMSRSLHLIIIKPQCTYSRSGRLVDRKNYIIHSPYVIHSSSPPALLALPVSTLLNLIKIPRLSSLSPPSLATTLICCELLFFAAAVLEQREKNSSCSRSFSFQDYDFAVVRCDEDELGEVEIFFICLFQRVHSTWRYFIWNFGKNWHVFKAGDNWEVELYDSTIAEWESI